MSRVRIAHPTRANTYAEAGHDAVLGFFVDMMRSHRVIKSYDYFNPMFNRQRPLMGCLDFLVAEGFFTGDELNDALVWMQDRGRKPKSEAVLRVVEIVAQLRGDSR